jgi:hypothetical protein
MYILILVCTGAEEDIISFLYRAGPGRLDYLFVPEPGEVKQLRGYPLKFEDFETHFLIK